MTEKKSIDIAFYDFENQNADLLSELKTDDGILLWQIIKRPLFYKIVHHNYKQNTIVEADKKNNSRKVFYLLISFLNFFKILFIRKRAFLLTTDFRRKRNGNEVIEPLIDSIIESENPQPFLLGVQRRFLRQKDPAFLRNKPDFDLNILYYFKRISKIFYKEKNSQEVSVISEYLYNFLKKESVDLTLNLGNAIHQILENHYSEKIVFQIFYKIVKPSKIYTVDSLASGMHHAAQELNIDFYEIQHGFISDHKVDYIVHPELKIFREALLVPRKIFLFGDFYKNILLNRSIWKESDLQVFHKIDSYKREQPIHNDRQTFFYAQQWAFYRETINIINGFGTSNKKLIIKFHPNESREHLKEYHKLCNGYDNIEVASTESSIFEIAKQADFVFGFFTTVLLECAAMQIPTITLKIESSDKKYSIHQYVTDEKLKKIIPEIDFYNFLERINQDEEFNLGEQGFNFKTDYLQK